jgi:anti-sigma B factor antagonist
VAHAQTAALRITAASDGAGAELRLAGELDLATANALRARVRDLLEPDRGVRRLVLDLAGLEFLDVTGLGVILEAQRRLAYVGGGVVLRRPRPMVVRILNLLQVEQRLTLEP